MAAEGQEDQFLPPKLSARSVIRKQTVAATRGNGRDAPITAVRAIGPVGFDPNRLLIRPRCFGHPICRFASAR